MVEIVIDASELKNEGKDVIQGLNDFIKEKTGADVANESNKVTVKGENATVSKKYLRVLVKKFLHKKQLKDYFRVISGNEETLKVKERKLLKINYASFKHLFSLFDGVILLVVWILNIAVLWRLEKHIPFSKNQGVQN